MQEQELDKDEEKKLYDIPMEILFVSSFYKKPDLYVSWGRYVKSKYDLYDEATRFFYDCFEIYYKNFSQIVDETKVNTFMSENEDRLKKYKRFGGYKTIILGMKLVETEDFNNYYNTIKKYSLIREYDRTGYNVKKILYHKKFNNFTAKDIYRLIRAKVDKINTVILSNEESIVLNNGMKKEVLQCLKKPDIGIAYPYSMLNELFRGVRLQNMVCFGMLSNEGKTRFMIKLASYLAFVKNEKVLILANEMTEKEVRQCLITTVINNPEFQELHGIHIKKPEKEIVLGLYKDKKGEFIYKKTDDNGNIIETQEDYLKRLNEESQEYQQVMKVAEWIEKEAKGKLFIRELINYDDITLEFEIRKHKLIYDINYIFYDTLKNDNSTIGDWAAFKLTTTKLKELANQLKIYLYGSIQMTDDSAFCSPLALTSNNISNCKQIKHLLDQLVLCKKISKDEYSKYKLISDDDWGEPTEKQLDESKTYYAFSIDKNRQGEKKVLVFTVDLNLNVWLEEGILIKG